MAESVFVLATFAMVICGTVRAVKGNAVSLRKRYVLVCSLLLLIWEAIQHIVDMGLFTGRYGVSAWSLEIPDFTGAIMFLLNLATCVFVFKEDFSPLFLGEAAKKHTHNIFEKMNMSNRMEVVQYINGKRMK